MRFCFCWIRLQRCKQWHLDDRPREHVEVVQVHTKIEVEVEVELDASHEVVGVQTKAKIEGGAQIQAKIEEGAQIQAKIERGAQIQARIEEGAPQAEIARGMHGRMSRNLLVNVEAETGVKIGGLIEVEIVTIGIVTAMGGIEITERMEVVIATVVETEIEAPHDVTTVEDAMSRNVEMIDGGMTVEATVEVAATTDELIDGQGGRRRDSAPGHDQQAVAQAVVAHRRNAILVTDHEVQEASKVVLVVVVRSLLEPKP